MNLLPLQPLHQLKIALTVAVFLMLQACTSLPQVTADKHSVAKNKAPDLAIMTSEGSSLISPSPETKAKARVAPAIAVGSLAWKITHQPTDAIAFWLGEAAWAFEQDKLTTPKADNAYYYLNRVLAKDSQNPLAIVALEKIVKRYYALLQSSLARGKVEQARIFWSRAQKVMPKHGQLTHMLKLINSHKLSPSMTQERVSSGPKTAQPVMRNQQLALPIKLVNQQDQGLAKWLVMVALQAQDLQATMLIVAPKDAQARWVYQTMNAADPEQRIRANIKHSRPARIEVSYLAREDQLEVYSNYHHKLKQSTSLIPDPTQSDLLSNTQRN